MKNEKLVFEQRDSQSAVHRFSSQLDDVFAFRDELSQKMSFLKTVVELLRREMNHLSHEISHLSKSSYEASSKFSSEAFISDSFVLSSISSRNKKIFRRSFIYSSMFSAAIERIFDQIIQSSSSDLYLSLIILSL